MQALWALVLGLQVSLGSLALGHASAHLAHRWLLKEGRCSPLIAAPHAHSSAADGTAHTNDELQPPLRASLKSAAARPLPGVMQLCVGVYCF